METWFYSGFLKSHCLAYLQQIFSIKGIFEMPSCYTNLIFRDFLNTCYSTPIWWGYCWGSFNLYQLGCVGFMCLFPLRGFIYSHQPCFWNNWEAAGGLGSKWSLEYINLLAWWLLQDMSQELLEKCFLFAKWYHKGLGLENLWAIWDVRPSWETGLWDASYSDHHLTATPGRYLCGNWPVALSLQNCEGQ